LVSCFLYCAFLLSCRVLFSSQLISFKPIIFLFLSVYSFGITFHKHEFDLYILIKSFKNESLFLMLSMLKPGGTLLECKNDLDESTHAQFRDACAGRFLSTPEDNPVRRAISCGLNSLTVAHTDTTVYLHRRGLYRPTGQAA
jgi:hypothetical protein